MSENNRSLSTLCVHAGDHTDGEGAPFTPLYNHSTFAFPDTQTVLDVIEGRKSGNLYTRYGMNPTIRSVEEKLAQICGAEAAFVFGSGMAAESATLLGHCKSGDHIVCVGDIYGGTYELLAENLTGLGIRTTFILGHELASLESAFEPTTRVLYLETPTNPNLHVFDIEAMASVAHRHGALLVVDNTFASPVNQRPLELGADLVVESATKFLGGHSDLTGGVVTGASAHLAPIAPWRKNLGQMMAPDIAHLLARSLRSLFLRVRAQNDNALELARRLSAHPNVVRVNYPGLESHPGHEIAQRQMSGGYGGMLSFVVRGDNLRDTSAVVDRLRLFTLAPSLGGVESLVTQPVTTTHHGMTPEERARRGITDGLVRLSVGIEDVADLWRDLEAALA